MDVVDKTVLITGSTDGVGKRAALELARAGARVLLHGRRRDKGERVLAENSRSSGSDKLEHQLEYYLADFSSLAEVRRLAEAIDARHDRLDILINNAGIGFGSRGGNRELSRDGYELRFAVNYLAPFLLTRLLLPLLRQSAPARIVNVASAGQYPIDFEDVMLERSYDGVRAYRQSKLAEIMLSFDLAEELAGSGITVNALHPATYMNTNMVIESGIEPVTSVDEGADAILYLAAAPALRDKTGLYFNRKQIARADPQAYDPSARGKLRELSLRLTGLAEPKTTRAARGAEQA
jgi:NAD(P)-dependent dehydrogenase (short-subunit alcohol dehydrogenase family)